MAPRRSSVTASDLAKGDSAPATDAPATEVVSSPGVVSAGRAASKPRKTQPQTDRRVVIAPMPENRQGPPPMQQANTYLPDSRRHMSEMGPVAMENWIGFVEGVRISVRFGAPKSTIPAEIIELMAASGIGFEQAEPPANRGAVILDQDRPRAPRARRTDRNRPERSSADRPFAPLLSMPE